MNAITAISSRTVNLPLPDIDTDQIIPARFLTTTSREGLGRHCFADRRFLRDGTPDPSFPLNRPEHTGSAILVAGPNFGCGSSREHAPWAMLDMGLRAVVSTRFADIFRSNAARNGLLPIVVDGATHAWLLAHEGSLVHIDLPARTLRVEGGPTAAFPFDPFTAHCLIHGCDELGFLLAHADRITTFEETHA